MKPSPGPKKDNNKKYAAIGVLVVAAIAFGSIFFYHYMNHQNAEEYYEHAVKEIEYQNTYQAGQYLKAALYFDDEYGDDYFLWQWPTWIELKNTWTNPTLCFFILKGSVIISSKITMRLSATLKKRQAWSLS
jgi:hypothetical protein